MNKRYYEIEIFGDEFNQLDKGIYPSIAEMPDEYNTEYLWITSQGKKIVSEEWPEDLFFKLKQDVTRDTCLYNLSRWLLFNKELCDSIKNANITGFQFLPVKVYDMKGKIINDYSKVANVDNNSDCMDLEKSIYVTYRDFFGKESDIPQISSDKIIRVKKLVLKKEKIPETNIFKLGNMNRIISDEKFVDLFTSHNYSGLSFKEVDII